MNLKVLDMIFKSTKSFLDSPSGSGGRNGEGRYFSDVDYNAPRLRYENTVQEISGWIAVEQGDFDRMELRVNGMPLPFARVARPDVRAAFPGKATMGYRAHADMLALFGSDGAGDSVVLQVLIAEQAVAEHRLAVNPGTLPALKDALYPSGGARSTG